MNKFSKKLRKKSFTENLIGINPELISKVVNSINNNDKWMYFERIMTRGKMHKLGQNVLKANNILELQFNNRGILIKQS